jgi:2-iminoacetate synthase ThiH
MQPMQPKPAEDEMLSHAAEDEMLSHAAEAEMLSHAASAICFSLVTFRDYTVCVVPCSFCVFSGVWGSEKTSRVLISAVCP